MATATTPPAVKCQEGAIFHGRSPVFEKNWPFLNQTAADATFEAVREKPRLCARELSRNHGRFFGVREQGVADFNLFRAMDKYACGWPTSVLSSCHRLDVWSELAIRYSNGKEVLPTIYSLASAGFVDYPVEYSAQVVACEDGVVMGEGDATTCRDDLHHRTKLPHYLVNMSPNAMVIPQWRVLPLDVDNCIHGGVLMNSSEAFACSTLINSHSKNGALLFHADPGYGFGMGYHVAEFGAEHIFCQTTGFCGR